MFLQAIWLNGSCIFLRFFGWPVGHCKFRGVFFDRFLGIDFTLPTVKAILYCWEGCSSQASGNANGYITVKVPRKRVRDILRAPQQTNMSRRKPSNHQREDHYHAEVSVSRENYSTPILANTRTARSHERSRELLDSKLTSALRMRSSIGWALFSTVQARAQPQCALNGRRQSMQRSKHGFAPTKPGMEITSFYNAILMREAKAHLLCALILTTPQLADSDEYLRC